MKKRILSIFMTLAMLFTLLPVSVYAEPEAAEPAQEAVAVEAAANGLDGVDPADEAAPAADPAEDPANGEAEPAADAGEQAAPADGQQEVAPDGEEPSDGNAAGDADVNSGNGEADAAGDAEPAENVEPAPLGIAAPEEEEEEAAEEESAEGIEKAPAAFAEIPAQMQEATAVADAADDGEDLFLGYLYRMSGLDPALASEHSNNAKNVPVLGKTGEHRNALTQVEQLIYDAVATEVEAVAANGGSTQFEVDVSIPMAIAASELNPTASNYLNSTHTALDADLIDQARTEYYSRVGMTSNSVSNVVGALLVDMPYDLYWFWKTVSFGIGYVLAEDQEQSYSDNYYEKWYFTGVHVVLNLVVIQDYQGANEYTVSSAKATAAQQAKSNAQAIVTSYASSSDYAKLSGYMNEIKSRVSYDNAALNSNKANSQYYTDSWQVVNVFDGNNSTNVVCEGYAKAFKFLCDLSSWSDPDFACHLITGNMSGGTGAGGHMWNVVHIGNYSYLVDVTNCDGNSVGNPDKLFMKAPSNGGAYHDQYTFTNTNPTMYFTYDNDTKSLFSQSELTLRNAAYNEYTVTFNLKGETSTNSFPSSITVPAGGRLPTALGVPTAAGVAFQSWYTDSDCTSVWTTDTSRVNGNITLYAKWTASSVLVTYNRNFDSEDNTSVNKFYSTGTGVLPYADTELEENLGYLFTGWNTEKDGTGTTYQPGDKPNLSAYANLYAQWEQRGIRLHVHATGGTGVISATVAGNPIPGLADTNGDYIFLIPGSIPGSALTVGNTAEVIISRTGCATLTYTTAAYDEDNLTAENVTLLAKGDFSGNGTSAAERLNDMQTLFDFLSKGVSTHALYTSDQDYFMDVADVNGDDAVNILDYQALYVLYRQSLLS